MSRRVPAALATPVPPEEIARLTAHIGTALDHAAANGAASKAALRLAVLRPLAARIAALELPRARRIDVVLAALASHDGDWAQELVASRDTIGRALDEIAAGSKPPARAARRSKSGARSSQPRGPRLSSKVTATTPSATPSAAGSDNGMVFHEDLWGTSR